MDCLARVHDGFGRLAAGTPILVLACALWLAGPVRARCAAAVLPAPSPGASAQQDPSKTPPPAQQDPSKTPPPAPIHVQDPVRGQDEGKIVRSILIEPPTESAEGIRSLLKTKVGQPLRAVDVAEDLSVLRSRLEYLCETQVRDVDGGIEVIFIVEERTAYDRIVFKGLEKFTEREVRTLLGLDPRRRLNKMTAEQYAFTLRERYRRNGYAFAQIRIEEDADTSTLTFFVDEGPKVTVRELYFRGNKSFPEWAPLGLYQNLIGSAGLESTPAGLFGGSPYSEEIVEEDLDRLREFYRRQGWRDAEAELFSVVFSKDHSTVDLTIRIIEGPRYKIVSVALEQTPPVGHEEPLYPEWEVMKVVRVRPGDYYDYSMIQADERAIAEFYGKRGHPEKNRFGRGLEDAFEIGDPGEVIDPEKAEIALTYQLSEGSRKFLRDVVISGNDYTEDKVIRRHVYIFPGEVLDQTLIEKSLIRLDGLRYFQDPQDFSGVSFELLPVPVDPKMVDLAVKVKEGDTGSFLWGAGISTTAGVQARFVLSKRNFDIGRLPSSFNPVTIVSEIADNSAFHGAGQELELLLAPGTEISLFQLSFYEPDLFNRYFDTIGLRVQAFRTLQFFDTYQMDAIGGTIGLERNFTDTFGAGVSFRQETVDVDDIVPNAPTVVWAAEGSTEMRGMRLNLRFEDLDHPLRPTDGYTLRVFGEGVGGPFGAQQNFFKVGAALQYYVPLYTDTLRRRHVLYIRQSFDWGTGFGDTPDLFLTERYYMGGSTLRGFDQRRAGPTQFGEPTGGEARYLGTFEYQFPLISTRQEGQLRQTEFLRGVVFTDFGLLGSKINAPDFREPRLSAGFGLRIQVPLLNVPIALDFAWPILDEDTDQQRQFFFSLARF